MKKGKVIELAKDAGRTDEQTLTDGMNPHKRGNLFDLDILDRASESAHELDLVSSFACIRASELSCVGDAGTMDAISIITNQAARLLDELADLMSKANSD